LYDPTEGAATSAAEPLYVVGIGASAGGLEALERFFKAMPESTGMAFVVIQHLSPDFRSLMDELLARHTRLEIHRVTDGMPVEPDSIYLLPPKKEMIISDGRLLLTDKEPQQDLSLPIDHFFRSLAQDAGDRAVAIVLSGTGSDGSRGIRDVHEAGGLVLAQRPETAQFDGMPRNACETGVVAGVLAPEEMAEELVAHAARARTSLDPAQRATAGVDAIFKLLRDEYGIDFSYYKPNTVERRIDRRLTLNQCFDIEGYVERLRRDPEERNALYRDLLIGVTRFFRDREAFDRLEREVVADLIARRRPEEEVRVWVAGCATGEEAYSLAILFDERFRAAGRPPNVKIFASDVHRASLDVASAGVYAEDNLAEVSPARLQRYFVRKGHGYQVASELRQMLVFAVHNVIKDAPFTKLDLITCRNLLIYFQPPVQKKVVSLFHFGLRTGGMLFLGPSESTGELAEEFEDLDPHWKIYRKRRDIRLPSDMRLPLSQPVHLRTTPPLAQGAQPFDTTLAAAYDRLLDRYMPSGVLVSDRRGLVHSFGDVSRYFAFPRGRATMDVLELVKDDLRLPLAGALQRAAKDRAPRRTHLAARRAERDRRRRARQDDGRADLQPALEPDALLRLLRSARRGSPARAAGADRDGVGPGVARARRGPRGRAAPHAREPSGDGRGARDEQRGAAGLQRGARREQRGAAEHERGAALGQRGAVHRQRGVPEEDPGADRAHGRHGQPAAQHRHRHDLPRPRPVHPQVHAADRAGVRPPAARRRPPHRQLLAQHPLRRPARRPGHGAARRKPGGRRRSRTGTATGSSCASCRTGRTRASRASCCR
jgi:two-component system CheB/CheR fusion protein